MSDRRNRKRKTRGEGIARASSGELSAGGAGGFGSGGRQGSTMEAPGAEVEFAGTGERKGSLVVYINSDSIGGRDSPHGRDLMQNFLYTLTEIAPQPSAIILVNSAVRLALPGSAALESLSLMHEQGVEIMVAESSLAEFEGGDKVAVGKPLTMHAILHALLSSDKVLNP